ncbi:putative Ras-related protein [Reticulomyxa filosa]|uniref:Putative Ras-related protein n=1 Tax=Reticulomyxa filosa TaxID=46433 RepID=X6MGC0_RETFI|nr:putative Ras-related protein [Reticulomyxa filosa]|eukprot:ETO12100.1 putative Ras-related protein [Reticulomyxa filosa]
MLKIIVLGDSGVGKTALLNSFAGNRLTKFTNQQLGVWDTAGQERHLSLGSAFFRGADACVLVFDCTNESSFRNIGAWRNHFIHDFGSFDPKTFPFLLCGNKCDLLSPRIPTLTPTVTMVKTASNRPKGANINKPINEDKQQKTTHKNTKKSTQKGSEETTGGNTGDDSGDASDSEDDNMSIHGIGDVKMPRSSTKPFGTSVNMIAAKSFADHYDRLNFAIIAVNVSSFFKKGMLFYQTSALDGTNVEKAFLELIYKASGINQSSSEENRFTITDVANIKNTNEQNIDKNTKSANSTDSRMQNTASRYSGKGLNLQILAEREAEKTQNNSTSYFNCGC